MYNTKLFWILILTVAFVLRLYGLGLNPVGLNHDDELHEIINAKSLAITGLHAPGRVAGILTQGDNCPGNCVYGELGSYLFIPWMLFFPLDIFWSKVPFAIASVLLVFFTGKLFENLTKSKITGILVGLSVALNPWSIHFGRTAYFTTFAYLFYIIGAYFYTRHKPFKSNLIFGTLVSFMGFLFYFGTKPILPLIFVWGLLYNFYTFKLHSFKFVTILIIIFFLTLAGYFIILSNSYAGKRMSEIGPGSSELIKSQVDEQRRVTLEIPIL